MNQAVANRLLRMDRTIEAADGKLDEVLRLLRPIATPVGVIRTPEGWGDTPPPAPGPPPPGLGLTEPGSVSQWGKIHPPSEETQRAVGEHIVERLSSPVLLDWRGAPHGAAVLAALHEFGYEVEDGTGAGDAVRAALHAERRARDAANIDAGEARAEAAALRKELADELVAREELAGELNRALDVSVRRQVAAEHLAANMDRTIEAVDGKLDEVLRLLRPIASGEIPVDAQADVAARILGQLEGPDSAAAAIHTDVAAVLSEFGHGVDGGTCADSVRAALHAERRARDAAKGPVSR